MALVSSSATFTKLQPRMVMEHLGGKRKRVMTSGIYREKKEGIKWSVFWHHHQASRWAENSSHDGSAMIPFLGYATARERNNRCPI